MKFIHCADLHLDSKIEYLPREKTSQRREEVLRAFERMTEFASEAEITAVIIAGDMFDTSKISIKTKRRILHAIDKASNVDFLYLSGNHDEQASLSDAEVLPTNLKFFKDEWTSFRYGDTVISGVRFTNKNTDFIYDTLSLSEKDKNIVVLHGQVVGFNDKSGAENISIPRLKNKNIDYLALGHIHSFSQDVIDNRGIFVYSGCLEGRGFDEVGEKGFVILDTSEGQIEYEFVKTSVREFYEFTYSVSGKSSFYQCVDEIVDELNAIYKPTSLIKVVLKGEHNADFIVDKDSLSEKLNEKFFFAKVKDKTTLIVKEEDFSTDKTVRGEFVREVLKSGLKEEEISKIIICGLNALKGEEIL